MQKTDCLFPNLPDITGYDVNAEAPARARAVDLPTAPAPVPSRMRIKPKIHYFITFQSQRVLSYPVVRNTVTEMHPLDWIAEYNRLRPATGAAIVFWREIPEDLYRRYRTGIWESSLGMLKGRQTADGRREKAGTIGALPEGCARHAVGGGVQDAAGWARS